MPVAESDQSAIAGDLDSEQSGCSTSMAVPQAVSMGSDGMQTQNNLLSHAAGCGLGCAAWPPPEVELC